MPYWGFQWHPDVSEDREPSLVLVWVVLPGLLPNFYHESILKNIIALIGRYLRRDNTTKCATQTDGAQVCVEMDATKDPLQGL